jgi:hypothetical protein
MISGVSLKTCWAIKKHCNNEFYYTVASCWLFLYDLIQNFWWKEPSSFRTLLVPWQPWISIHVCILHYLSPCYTNHLNVSHSPVVCDLP